MDNEATVDGFEPHLGVNHYGHFLLRVLLTPTLTATAAAGAEARVVVVASSLHDRMFNQKNTTLDLRADPKSLGWKVGIKSSTLQKWTAYSRSKLANVMSAAASATRLAELGVACVSLHPGIDTSTGLFRGMPIGRRLMALVPGLGLQSTWQSIQTILYCTLAPQTSLVPGAFYSQHLRSGYRDGATGGMPMKSMVNPMVNPEDCVALEVLS